MAKYVIPPDGIAGVIIRSVGGNIQVWPSGDVGLTGEPTTVWTPGDVQYAQGANQIILWASYSPGPYASGCRVKLETSYNNIGWYQEASYVEYGLGIKTYSPTIHILPSGTPVPIAIPSFGEYMRISAMETGNPSGSILGVIGTIASVM